jgi:hypothetical protein
MAPTCCFELILYLLTLPCFVQPGVSPGLGSPVESWSLAELVLQDILFFGDGCIFLDMVRVLSLCLEHTVHN